VLVLIAGIVVLSLGDLIVTVATLRTTGMFEANPVAAWLISQTGSVTVLGAYKLLTVAVCAGLLFRLRRHAEGEAGAWCAMLILALTCLHWYHYSVRADSFSIAARHSEGRLVLD
jgi:hypothetical protein